MATISSQSTRTGGRAGTYATKDAVAVSALNATVPGFERRLQEIRRAHGKDGLRPRVEVDENGRLRRDENGNYVVAKDSMGNTVYESKYVEAYSLVQSFGHDELDPSDPESWTRANALGRVIAEDRFPGHPALVATEINGRSGCVHNHIIVGAIHPETGRSIDSNLVTHSRLALAHDRVLAEQGFTQRSDMQRIAQAAAAQVEQRRTEVEAEAGFSELSPSQQQRRLLAAEKSVRLEGRDADTAHQKREVRRRRELVKYEQNEVDREIALDLGVTPPAERFSEIELEGRIRATLSDPRALSWEDVAEIGRENRVTIERRGENDVTYGMMLVRPDGTVAEPLKNHRRRGGVEGAKTQGLGDGFRRDDIEAAIAKNVALQAQLEQEEAERLQSQIDRQDNLKSEQLERLDGIREAMATNALRADEMEAEIDAEIAALQERLSQPSGREVEQGPAEQQEPDVQAADSSEPAIETAAHETPTVGEVGPAAQEATEEWEPETQAARVDEPATEPRFRSRLRDRRARNDKSRAKLDAIAQLEEDYYGYEPDAEFEERANASKALGQRFVNDYGDQLSPEFRAHIEARVAQAAERSAAFDERTALLAEQKRLAANRRPFDPAYDDAVAKNRRGLRFYDGYIERIETDRRQGNYRSRAHERDEQVASEKQIAENHRKQRVADLEPVDTDAAERADRVTEALSRLQGDRRASRRVRSREDDGLEM